MKTIMISTYKKYVEMKQDGTKEYEIRPFMIQTPFRVVEYEPKKDGGSGKARQEYTVMCGKPITYPIDKVSFEIQNKSGLTRKEMLDYSRNETRKLYAWHISDLKVYYEPKELSSYGLTKAPQKFCYVRKV